MTHIKDLLIAELMENGWDISETDGEITAKKRMTFEHLAGNMSDGTRLTTLQINSTGRWFSHVDGWGHVIKDVDLRNFWGEPAAAISALLGSE